MLEHSYNTLGLLEDEHVTLNGNLAQSWHQTWNAAGNRTALTLNNPPTNGEKGSNRTYAYDALGRMTMASNDATGKSTYTYAAHGLSARRTPWITQAVEERKTQENGLVGQVNTYVKGQDVLFEHLTWRSDHKLASQRLQRKGNAQTSHSYHYDALGQLEKDIYTYPGLGVTPTYTYGYDVLGVLTDVSEQGNIDGNTHWDCNLDPLHRIAQETIDIEQDAKLLLEGDTEGCVRQVHVSANGGNRVEAALEQLGNDMTHWKAYLSNIKIGESNRIKVTATNDEDIATDEVFERLLEPYVASTYDELGNLTRRYNALTGEGTEYLWDTWGRLINVACNTADGQTKTWTYRYDALGRRLETQYEGDQFITIQSFYDPEFEYLELGLTVGATTVWKQYGPDSSGYYGELNGIGGLEGVINGKTGDSTGTINDITGNIVAYTDDYGTFFLVGNIDNYGRLSGDAWLDEESGELIAQTTFWVLKNSRFRGRRVEGNGLSNFGARYYNTETGSFLSADPYGHDGSLDLYSCASADPVNYVDPDGRLSQPVNEGTGSYLEGVGDVFKGYGDAAVGTAQGLYQVARHPVNTAKNLWTLGNKAVRNPSKAFNVIKTGISEKLETNRGAGELIGTALIGVATGSTISTGTKAGLAYASSRMAGTQAAKVATEVVGVVNRTPLIRHTRHSLNQKINRQVRSIDELNAIRNPLKEAAVKADAQGRLSQKFIGEKATVAINPETRRIVTVHPTSSKLVRRLKH